MKKIEAVIFDLGRVIVEIDFSRSLFRLFRDFEQPSESIFQQLMTDDLIQRYNTGQIQPQEFYQAVKQKFNLDIDFAEFKDLWCNIFSPMPGMEELIRELEGKVKLGLFSNTDPLHYQHICDITPIMEIFDRPTLSYEIGMQKPAGESYQIAARNVDTAAEKCLYIDDLLENVEAAQQAGMQGIQFTSIAQLRNELAVRKLL
jgi:glucose-1-phosphatase